MKKTAVLLAACVLTMGCAAMSCSPASGTRTAPSESSPPRGTVSVVDSLGRTVEVARPVTRAVVVYSQMLLAMKAIGVPDERVAGVDEFTYNQYKDVFPGLRGKPTVGKNLFNLDVEKLVSLGAEVLIAAPTMPGHMPELEARLARSGTKVVYLDFNVRDVKDVLGLLGTMFGAEARAGDFSRFWFEGLDRVAAVVARVPERERTKVYWENTGTPYDTINRSSSGHEIVALAGGLNIAQDLVGTKADPEWVIARDPDVIIKYPMGSRYQGGFGQTDPAPFKAMREEIVARAGFGQVRAVKTGRVYIVSQLIKPGLFENVAIGYIAKILYPERFEDFDPETYFREMVESYLGLDFQAMRGVFVYPEAQDRDRLRAGEGHHRQERTASAPTPPRDMEPAR